MANKQIPKVVSRGEHKLVTQRLKDDFTGYTGEVHEWQGETEIVITPSQTVTELPSGDDPAWWVIAGAVTAEVEITMYDVPIDYASQLFPMKYSAADGLWVGDNDATIPWNGLTLDRTVESASGASVNKVVVQKVRFDLPAIGAKTIAKDDNALAELKLKGYAYPVFYSKADGSTGSKTYGILNSVKNKAKFDAYSDGIVFPSEFTPDAK